MIQLIGSSDMRTTIGLAIAGLLVMTGQAMGHESEPSFNRVSLTVTAERDVDNDTLVAVLFSEHQSQRQQAASNSVNSAIRWALDITKERGTIKVQTTQYNTSPIYDKQAITGWRARQSIRLESKDSKALSELIGMLQEKLSIASVNYTVSKAARNTVEESSISEALIQYRRRADLVASDLGRKSYRVVQLNINAHGTSPQPMAYATRGMAAMEKSLGPAIEAGVQKVAVNISGNIELDVGTK
jgi:predicted secreted protein